MTYYWQSIYTMVPNGEITWFVWFIVGLFTAEFINKRGKIW